MPFSSLSHQYHTMVDPRQVIGAIVVAKAHHVTSEAECARRYGSKRTEKMLEGTVVAIKTKKNPPNNQLQTFILADYNLGGGSIKTKTINLQSDKVKGADPVVQSVSLEAPLNFSTPTPINTPAAKTAADSAEIKDYSLEFDFR